MLINKKDISFIKQLSIQKCSQIVRKLRVINLKFKKKLVSLGLLFNLFKIVQFNFSSLFSNCKKSSFATLYTMFYVTKTLFRNSFLLQHAVKSSIKHKEFCPYEVGKQDFNVTSFQSTYFVSSSIEQAQSKMKLVLISLIYILYKRN